MKKYTIHLGTLLIIVVLLMALGGCMHSVNSKTKITGNYWLVQMGRRSNAFICLMDRSNICNDRVPAQVTAYAVADSLLVAKYKRRNNTEGYYIINMNQDTEFATPANYSKGPLSEVEFKNEWEKRAAPEFVKVDLGD